MPIHKIVAAATLCCLTSFCFAKDDMPVIGIAVLIGHELELARVGAMVFWNKRADVPVTTDRLSDVVYHETERQLLAERRYKVKRVQVSLSSVGPLADKLRERHSGLLNPLPERAGPELDEIRAACDCDTLLFVVGQRGQTNAMSNQSFRSIAWVAQSGLGKDAVNTAVAAFAMLYLYDAKAGTLLQKSPPIIGSAGPYSPSKVAPSEWPAEMSGLTERQWSNVERALALGLSLNQRVPLYHIGLRPSCTRFVYDLTYPPSHRSRREVDPAPPLPEMPQGSDPAWCT
jgi:hypothetical protein